MRPYSRVTGRLEQNARRPDGVCTGRNQIIVEIDAGYVGVVAAFMENIEQAFELARERPDHKMRELFIKKADIFFLGRALYK